MTTTTTTTTTTTQTCEECGTELYRAGTGTPQYWSCRYCGLATPIR